MDNELQNGLKKKTDDQTSKNLEAEVNILLADYERLKG
jgi:hypothetical protein